MTPSRRSVSIGLAIVVALGATTITWAAATKKDIDSKVDAALARFYKEVPRGSELTGSAKGVLVFPNVVKAGFGIGGEYGTGALRVSGKTNGYYSTTAASVGLQIGAESKSIVLCFMTDEALASFVASKSFEIGVDGSVAMINAGAGGAIDTTTAKAPVLGFVFGRAGLMANISLEGAKISTIDPE